VLERDVKHQLTNFSQGAVGCCLYKMSALMSKCLAFKHVYVGFDFLSHHTTAIIALFIYAHLDTIQYSTNGISIVSLYKIGRDC